MHPAITHLPSLKRALRDKIQLILLLIQSPMRQPKPAAAQKRQHRDRGVVPDKQRVGRERDKGLADGVGDGAREEENRGDDGAHVLGRLGEGVLEAGDGGEDLGEGDQEVGDGLHPDVDGRGVAGVVADPVRRVVAAGAEVVDVVLRHGRGYHGEGAEEEAPGDAFQRREADAEPFETGVEEDVGDGDEDDEGDGVDVVDEVVGGPVQFHGRGLRDQVVGHLVVGEPPQRVPEEDGAGFEAAAHFVDPDVVEGHPVRLVGSEVAWFDVFPEVICSQVSHAGHNQVGVRT